MRNILILNISFISSIIKDDTIITQSIVYPFTKFLFAQYCSCWVVWVTQINHVHAMIRNLWYEVVFCSTRHISNIAPLAILENASTTNHHITIYINRVYWVSNTDIIIPSHNLLDITCVTLGTVINEDLVLIKMYTTSEVIIFNNSLTKEIVSSFRTIATESSLGSHLLNSLVHSLYNSRTQRTGNITNT